MQNLATSWRYLRLIELAQKPIKPYTNWFLKLKCEDWTEMLIFLRDHDHMDVNEFQRCLNRYFLEFELRNKRPRPKNFIQLDEILGNVNVVKGGTNNGG